MHKVLVVDDSAFTRRMMCQHLEASGFDVIKAESGPEAIELYGQHQPDVVTLDLVMPDMEGEEVLQQFKEFDAGARVVVDGERPVGRVVGRRRRCDAAAGE